MLRSAYYEAKTISHRPNRRRMGHAEAVDSMRQTREDDRVLWICEKSSMPSSTFSEVEYHGVCFRMTFRPGRTVYHYFRTWRMEGVWEDVNEALRERVRVSQGRCPTPSAGSYRFTVCKDE